ncbi:MAG: sigma-70 family RNA polymerase sigma factor [Phycisphaera sp.]|nr:sigma-70 family RNA polymerase sigma factor [Phycisphaera sp.]
MTGHDTQSTHDTGFVENGPTEPVSHEMFLRLYSVAQRRVHAYIGAFLPNAADVDEVLQETSVVLWRKFGEFESGADRAEEAERFVRWSCGVARFEVLRFMRQHRGAAMPLDDRTLDVLADEHQAMSDELDERRSALQRCMQRLRDVDRVLVQRCYERGVTAKEVADELGRPVNSVYKSLGRIRVSLLQCIQRRLETGGEAMA